MIPRKNIKIIVKIIGEEEEEEERAAKIYLLH